MRVFVAVAVLVAACVPDNTSSKPPATGVPSASSSAASPVAVVADAAAVVDAGARVAMPEGPPKWKTIPREQNGFYAVLDGICSQLGAGRVGKDIVVHYGGGALQKGQREGNASFVALRDDGLESIGDPVISSPTGIAGSSLDDFWIADSTGSRSSEGAILHRRFTGGWKTYAKDQTHLHAWVDGGIIGTLGFAAATGEVWVEGSTTKPPAALHANMPYPALAAFPTGDIVLVGHKDLEDKGPSNGPLVARHWAPGKKISEFPLDKLLPAKGDYEWHSVHEVAPDEVYALRGSNIARWDGTGWHGLAKLLKDEKTKTVLRIGSDDLWVLTESSTVQHVTVTKAEPLAIPEPAVALSGPYLVGKSGKLYRRESETWKEMSLPGSVFSTGTPIKAKGVIAVDKDDVLITAQYWEKGLGWKDQELHTALYRTKKVKETLRCNEPDPENNNIHIGRGFQSWPPMAGAECATPFAVLARRSNSVKTTDDWPRIRAALKGHPELGEVSLVDFVSGDRTFVGAKVKDVETAKKLVAVVTKNDRLRPEVVCGDPDPKRTLAIDLTTGAATAK